MEANRCTSTRRDGHPCQAPALPDSTLCWAHDPGVQEKRKEGQRRGGQARSNAARAAKLLASAGQQIPDQALPAILKGLIVDVREGRVEPGTATAIANLCKTAVQLHDDLDVDRRLSALEREVEYQAPRPLRRVGS